MTIPISINLIHQAIKLLNLKEKTMAEKTVKNIIRDTRKNVKYIIMADRKLSRDEMLRQIRYYNFNTLNLKTKRDSTVTIEAREDV